MREDNRANEKPTRIHEGHLVGALDRLVVGKDAHHDDEEKVEESQVDGHHYCLLQSAAHDAIQLFLLLFTLIYLCYASF